MSLSKLAYPASEFGPPLGYTSVNPPEECLAKEIHAI